MHNQPKRRKPPSAYRAKRPKKSRVIWLALILLNVLTIIALTLVLKPEKESLKKNADPQVMALFSTLSLILKNNSKSAMPTDIMSVSNQASDADDKKFIINWLRSNWGLYNLNDPELIDAIEKLCEPKYEHDLIQYQQAMKPCINHKLVARLREQAKTHQPPFQHSGKEVRITVPVKVNQPTVGFAYTCFEGGLTNKKVILFGHNNEESLVVQLIGAYECKEQSTYFDIKLNEEQALTLFKHSPRAVEYAVALIQ